MNKVEIAEVAHNSAVQNLEKAQANYAKASSAMKEKVKKLEAELDSMYEKMVTPFRKAEEATNKVLWAEKEKAQKEEFLSQFKSSPEMTLVAKMIPESRHFNMRDAKLRIIKHQKPFVTVVGLTEEYGSEAWYFAFIKENIISALCVEKARHRGDFTTSYRYGADVVKENSNRSYYRTGLCMRDWINPEFVKFRGLTAEEKKAMEEKFFRSK